GFSDANVIAAATYFYDHGFLASYFQPVVGYSRESERREGIPKVYLHYPPLPDLLAGLSAKVFGTLDPRVLRIVPVLFSILWFYLIFFTVHLWIPNARLAEWSATMLVVCNYF